MCKTPRLDIDDRIRISVGAHGEVARRSALGMLSAAERERAPHVLAAGARAKFLVGRAALRVVLAAYLNGDPSQLRLAEDPEENRGWGSRAVLVQISTSATRMHWS
jgi:hypothetical protein